MLLQPKEVISEATTERTSGVVDLIHQLSIEHGLDREVMDGIIKCESSNKQVAKNHNYRDRWVHDLEHPNGGYFERYIWSTDWGLFQINDYYWDDDAQKLGFDYKNSREDNIKMAFHVYLVQGLSAWSASAYCWK